MDISSQATYKNGEADNGFVTPETGDYRIKFEGGVKRGEPNDKGNRSILIPSKIVDNEAFEGAVVNIFVPEAGKTGVKTLANILVGTGLAADFNGAFSQHTNPFDPAIIDAVINFLNVKLAGKFIKIHLKLNEKTGFADLKKFFLPDNVSGSQPVTGNADSFE